MSSLKRYNDWVIGRLRPWVGKTVLEVGSGTGNISRYFLDSEHLFLTDIRDDYIAGLKETFKERDNISFGKFDLESSGEHLRGKGVDTIIALNVLEHIDNDRNALKEIAAILAPGGRVILQLPAHPLLYGTLDTHLDHFRRYTMKDIREKFAECGLETAKIFRMNMFGALGWLMYSRIRKKDILPTGPLGLFNKLTPTFMAIENVLPAPFGLSIIAIGEKPLSPSGQ